MFVVIHRRGSDDFVYEQRQEHISYMNIELLSTKLYLIEQERTIQKLYSTSVAKNVAVCMRNDVVDI